MIRCFCGITIFDGLIMKKVSVAQFSRGYCNIKCKQCGSWLNGLNASIFLGADINYDFKRRVNDTETTHNKHPA